MRLEVRTNRKKRENRMTTDYKEVIIQELDVLRKKEQQEGNKFKVIAYSKVINQIRGVSGKITKMEDVEEVKGIGAGIRKKIEEILETGQLEVAQEAKKDVRIHMVDELMNVYGIGRVRARELVMKQGVVSIEDLKKKVAEGEISLNDPQKIGLKNYEDFLERIPRSEMKKHEKILMDVIEKEFELIAEIVGSYRRGLKDSGDIDVLIMWPEKKTLTQGKKVLEGIISHLQESGYITDTLAVGSKKFMGVCKVGEGGKARRLDILLTPAKEYPYAIMYFTGSGKFNIEMRKLALEKGYSLNEHGFTPLEGKPEAPIMRTEADIFAFLGLRKIEPKDRIEEIDFSKYRA